MALFRVTYYWQESNTRTGGWTENFWLNGPTGIDAAQPLADELRGTMAATKGAPTFCRAFRISPYPFSRVGQLFLTRSVPAAPTDDDQSDYPTTRYQLGLSGTSTKRVTMWYGGIQDSSVTLGGQFTPNANVVRNLAALRTILIDSTKGWSVYTLNPANLSYVVVAFNATTGVMTTSQPNGFITDDYVRVQRLRGVDGINGVWRIATVDATNFRLVGWVSSTDVMTRSNATVRKQGRVPTQINRVEVVQITKHNVGKPGGLLGGRRSRPGSSLVGPLVVKG